VGQSWFRRRRSYDRGRSLAKAAQARAKGRTRSAIEHYREVLAHEPHDPDVHRRIAPLLVAARQPDEAWQSYRIAYRGLVRAGFLEHAVGVLREAAGGLHRREVWEELAEIERERGRPADAHRALLEGRRAFGARADRGDAIRLLLAARRLAPGHFEANCDLARLLARSGAVEPAERILLGLAAQATLPQQRRCRALLFRARPGPSTLWRWIKSMRPQGASLGLARTRNV